jgi:hypothetical protein
MSPEKEGLFITASPASLPVITPRRRCCWTLPASSEQDCCCCCCCCSLFLSASRRCWARGGYCSRNIYRGWEIRDGYMPVYTRDVPYRRYIISVFGLSRNAQSPALCDCSVFPGSNFPEPPRGLRIFLSLLKRLLPGRRTPFRTLSSYTWAHRNTQTKSNYISRREPSADEQPDNPPISLRISESIDQTYGVFNCLTLGLVFIVSSGGN